MTVHIIQGSTGDAYDRTQWDDSIRDRDIILVPDEGVAGFLTVAWPVAITAESGQLHTLTPGRAEHFAETILAAQEAWRAHCAEHGLEMGEWAAACSEVQART